MAIENSRPEKSLEFLANQAVSLAGEIVREIDRRSTESSSFNRDVRHLAVANYNTMSKMVVMLLEKDKVSH